MKRVLCLALAVLVWVASSVSPVYANDDLVQMAQEAGYSATAEIAPKSAIVIDAETGQVLWGHDIDLQRDPASTTKTMVIYLTMEAIKAGKISMDTEVVATANDQAIAEIYALSNNKIQAGVSYTVSELLTMTLVPSSNVTTLMLAHLIFDGTDGQFVDLMNQTAKELGMTNTIFHNATGAVVSAFEGYYAPEGYDHSLYNLTTTKDLAILARALITKHPEILEFTNDLSVTVKPGTPYEETFEAYNHSLPGDNLGFEGVDGLKTGSSPSAGYNSIVTAQQGDRRVIAVVLGTSEWGDPQGEFVRHYFVNALLKHAFEHYERRELLPVGQHEIAGKTYEVTSPVIGLVNVGGELPEPSLVGDQAVFEGIQTVTGPLATPVRPASVIHQVTSKLSKVVDKEGKGTSNAWLILLLVGLALALLFLILFW